MSNPTPVVVANLKAHKTWKEIESWLDAVGPKFQDFNGTVIFCPSYPFLASAKEKIDRDSINIKLGSQDISKFEQGAYTGEVAASQIADLVEYTIIGHSERRQNFKEDDKVLEEKVENAIAAGIKPIFCVQNEETPVPPSVSIVAYEPVFAIGTGNPDKPENVQEISQKLNARLAARQANGQYTLLYGGSVSASNVKSFVDQQAVDGVLVGATNSLDPQEFVAILDALK